MPAIADWSPVDLLPGVWTGLLGAWLATALRRWFDPVPGRVLAVFTAVLLILFGPVLFGGKVLLPLDGLRGEPPFEHLPPTEPHGNFLQGDLIQLVTPSLAAVRAAWADGRWPLWNAQVGAGMPLLADPQAQAFQPLALLGAPLPLVRAAGVTAALRVLVALVFGFLWMRRQGLSEAPALAGSLAYGLGGFLLLWLGWPIANTAALLPLVLYGAARCDDPGGRRDGLLLAVGVLALLLGGHPETIAYALGLVLLFLLDKVRRRPAGLRNALLVRAGIAFVVAGVVAAPALLPAAVYVPKTLRAARLHVSSSTGSLAQSWLPIAAPNAYGNSRFVEYWGFSNTNEDASGFVGTAALLAALLAVGARRRFPQEGLALGIAVLCLLLITPFPGGSRRLLLPLSLCLCYLGACTLERFRMGEIRRRSLLIVAAGLALVIAWGYLAHPHPADPDRMAIFRFGWLRWQLRFLSLATLLLVMAVSWQRRGRTLAATGVAAAITAELLLIHGPANPPMPRRLAFPVNGPIEFLQQKLGKNPPRGPRYRMAALGEALPPNLASLYGLTDARIYNPMAPQSYVETTAPVTVAWKGEQPEWGHPDDPLYSRMGVRYLLAAPDAVLPLTRVYADRDASVWELPGARPRLFLPAGQIAIPRLEDSWITARIDLRRRQRLASSLYQDGGWRLLVEGRPRPTATDPGSFLTARLPVGSWRVDFLYRPSAFLWGCVLAALGLTLGAAAFVPRPSHKTFRNTAFPSPGA
ncbi:MAG TPA: hypothetical protein VHC97_01480 [Thermoanaerobaculia bacterium]|jgi:hypothetical protein|nr:hypothetical protein [Thermoanaerobaculia bacterium]